MSYVRVEYVTGHFRMAINKGAMASSISVAGALSGRGYKDACEEYFALTMITYITYLFVCHATSVEKSPFGL